MLKAFFAAVKNFCRTCSKKKNVVHSIDNPFDPYLHATTSHLFALLHRTDMQLLSPVQMLNSYLVAPVGGEFSKEGSYISVVDKYQPSFAKLRNNLPNGFTLGRLIHSYGKAAEGLSVNNMIEWLQRSLNHSKQICFTNINIILILMARLKQENINIQTCIQGSMKLFNEFYTDLKAAEQFFYLLLLFDKTIFPNYAIETVALSQYIKENCTFEKLIAKIKVQQIDIRHLALSNNPSQQDLQRVLNLFASPDFNSIFLLKKKQPLKKEHFGPNDIEYHFKAMVSNLNANEFYGSYAINHTLNDWIFNLLDPNFFNKTRSLAFKHAMSMTTAIKIFERLFLMPNQPYTPKDREFIEKPFGMILIDKQGIKQKLISKTTGEYRTTAPLKFGEDISMIAIEDKKDRRRIMRYLNAYGIYNVKVILYSQLFESLVDGKEPTEPVKCNFSPESIINSKKAQVTPSITEIFYNSKIKLTLNGR